MNRTTACFLLLAIAAAGWLKWQTFSLGALLDSARQENGTLSAELRRSRAAFDAWQAATRQQAQDEQTLRHTLDTAQRLALRREQDIQRLLNENHTLRDGFSTPLPADLVRLHQRPAFTGAADYLRWLSDGDPLPGTIQPTADTR